MVSCAPAEITVQQLDAMRRNGQPHVVLDVREPWELAICRLPGSLEIPLATLPGRLHELPTDRPVVVMCHHGVRSAQATHWLRSQGYPNATNLAGGIDAWACQIDPSVKVY